MEPGEQMPRLITRWRAAQQKVLHYSPSYPDQVFACQFANMMREHFPIAAETFASQPTLTTELALAHFRNAANSAVMHGEPSLTAMSMAARVTGKGISREGREGQHGGRKQQHGGGKQQQQQPRSQQQQQQQQGGNSQPSSSHHHGKPRSGQQRQPGQQQGKNTCYTCGGVGHHSSECPSPATARSNSTQPLAFACVARVVSDSEDEYNTASEGFETSDGDMPELATDSDSESDESPADPRVSAASCSPTPAAATDPASVAAAARAQRVEASASTGPSGRPVDLKYDMLFDTGSTVHVVVRKELFTTLHRLPRPVRIRDAGGRVHTARHAGTVEFYVATPYKFLECPEYGRAMLIRMEHVHYVPTMDCNMFSPFAATLMGIEFSMDVDGIKMYDNKCDPSLVAARTSSGLVIRVLTYTHEHTARAALADKVLGDRVEPAEWHRRFGHLSYQALAALTEHEMVTGMPTPASEFRRAAKSQCKPCVQGKRQRAPFPPTSTPARDALAVIHTDVCDATDFGLRGERYFVTAVDDATNFSIVTLLRHKHEAADAVRDMLAWFETQAGRKVKALRSDRGGEFLPTEFQLELRARGIDPQFSAPGVSQQNGKAERLNRTLLDKSRCMLADSGLPPRFWSEAVPTANFLRNRSPSAGLTCTPYEKLLGVKPDVSLLLPFGAPVFVRIDGHKFQPRMHEGRFMGYAGQGTSYRILYNHKVRVSRDVVPGDPVTIPVVDDDNAPDLREGYDADEPLADATPAATAPRRSGRAVAAPVRYVPTDFRKQPSEPTPESPEAPAPDAAAPVPPPTFVPFVSPVTKPAPPAVVYSAAVRPVSADIPIPNTYAEAMASPQRAEWLAAMQDELNAQAANGTWELSDLPPGKRTIPARWVFAIKRDSDGNILRYKARLVAKGFLQRPGIDFDDVSAPTPDRATLRAVIAMAASRDWELHVVDVKNAFLHADMKEELYLRQPPGFDTGDGRVCRLRKALYGLRQAPHDWRERLERELVSLGFTVADSDPSLFILRTRTSVLHLLVHVDDMLLASPDAALINRIKQHFARLFGIRDLGEASVFCGFTIERDRHARTVKLSQPRLCAELVDKHGMTKAKPASVPMSPDTNLVREGVPMRDPKRYMELVGSLLYLATCTRPDIAQAVGVLARFMSAPTDEHWHAARHVVRYLSGTVEHGIVYGSSSSFEGYTDASFGNDPDTRRSTTATLFLLNGGALNWHSTLQRTVALSTTEAEYMAASAAVREALFLRNILRDLGVQVSPIPIMADNQGCIALMSAEAIKQRSKHIDIQYHFAREHVRDGTVVFKYVSTHYMHADSLTKVVPVHKFLACKTNMGMR
jgi:transposase InsO family protein